MSVRQQPAKTCPSRSPEIFEGRGETAHLRSEIGGSLVLIQQVQPKQNHGGGDTDQAGSAGHQTPNLGSQR
jgi:hypothetical protein